MRFAGEYEHRHTSHVCRVQLEPHYSWLDPVFFFLGLPPYSGCYSRVLLIFQQTLPCILNFLRASFLFLPPSSLCISNLKQIAGGIWADTFGGKLVLGFGVVWWSIATALTPIAAKVGLPFLLVVRAFMGIGEVSSFIHLVLLRP